MGERSKTNMKISKAAIVMYMYIFQHDGVIKPDINQKCTDSTLQTLTSKTTFGSEIEKRGKCAR